MIIIIIIVIVIWLETNKKLSVYYVKRIKKKNKNKNAFRKFIIIIIFCIHLYCLKLIGTASRDDDGTTYLPTRTRAQCTDITQTYV